MFLSLFSVIIMSLTGFLSKELMNRNYQIRNILSFAMTFITILSIALFNFIDYDNLSFKKGEFIFFYDPIFYIMISFGIINQITLRKFIKSNEDNLVYISITNFAFLAVVPLVSVLSIYLFSFDETLNTKYDSLYETIAISLALGLLSFLMFAEKIKNKKIKRPDIMIVTLISSSFAFVLMNKLMQVYSAPSIYIISTSISMIMWFSLSMKTKDRLLVKKGDSWLFFIFPLQYIIYSCLNMYIVDIIPTEHIAILRSVIGVFIAFSFDYFLRGRADMTVKDSLILTIFVSFLFYLKF